jgi:hypothetical protein
MENGLFFGGLTLLAGAAYYVPSMMGLDRGTAFIMAIGVAAAYVWGFKYIAEKVPVRFEDDEE